MEEQEKCKGGHKVDGKVPMLTDIHLDKRTCDCGRLKYISEMCGCETNKHLELKQYPNE